MVKLRIPPVLQTLAPLPAVVPAQFPDCLAPLFEPKRLKILWGGRGAGRSWSVARALLIMGTTRPIRILCARELQNSLAESVHKLLSDQITALGLAAFYKIEVGRIFSYPGMFPDGAETSFSFEGIKNNTRKIKSYEGVDYCWVEEAVAVSRASWMILIPTIRKAGSEIWMTFNPELETDYTYTRFVLKANPERSFVIKMTWRDNPWFPEELRAEMEELRETDYDAYLNVWEGHCVQMLEGVVYAKELRLAQSEERICRVPWDKTAPVETFWDLGRADQTAIWFAQRVGMQWRILDYLEASGQDISFYLKELEHKPYVYGAFHLPHDAKAKRLGSKRTIEEIIRNGGQRQVRIVPKLSIADGINAARTIFGNCWFDQINCVDGLNRLRHYRYAIVGRSEDNQPLYSKEPVHDSASDGADAFRYMAIALRSPAKPSSLIGKIKERVESQLAFGRSSSNFERPGNSQAWMG